MSKDRQRDNGYAGGPKPWGASSVGTPEYDIFGEDRTVPPAVETLPVLLDCGVCTEHRPQAEVRAGTADATCTKKHNRRPKETR